MDASRVKPKRQRKRQSRTEVVVSSDSESDHEYVRHQIEVPDPKAEVKANVELRRKPATRQRPSVLTESAEPQVVLESDPKVAAAFRGYYMQRVANELSEDLDQLRNADDFNNAALPVLLQALEQGTSMFSPEEQTRLVEYS